MAFTAKDVMDLRTMTGAGMMDCKKALTETDGDKDKAVAYLREKGIAKAAKKSGRVAAEGMVYSYIDKDAKTGVLVEVNCETDFVSRGDDFKELVDAIAKKIHSLGVDFFAKGEVLTDEILAQKEIAEMVTNAIAKIGENITVRRCVRFDVTGKGIIDSYIHMGGKIGVAIEVNCTKVKTAKSPEYKVLAHDIALQIASMNPEFLDSSQVSAEKLDSEKAILVAQIKEDPKFATKPQKVLDGIVTGRINKYYEENCLLNQKFFKDPSVSIETMMAGVAKTLDDTITVRKFVRYECGEGIEKAVDNFAEEVNENLEKLKQSKK